MTREELCRRFGISPGTFQTWRKRGIIPAPDGGRTRKARYGLRHVEAIQAHLALRHNNVSTAAAVAYCAEAGITLAQFVRQREEAVKTFGIGVA